MSRGDREAGFKREREGSTAMLGLKYLLMILGLGLFGSTGALLAYDIYVSEQLRKLVLGGKVSGRVTRIGMTASGEIEPRRRRAA
jgi:hypothetical protein